MVVAWKPDGVCGQAWWSMKPVTKPSPKRGRPAGGNEPNKGGEYHGAGEQTEWGGDKPVFNPVTDSKPMTAPMPLMAQTNW